MKHFLFFLLSGLFCLTTTAQNPQGTSSNLQKASTSNGSVEIAAFSNSMITASELSSLRNALATADRIMKELGPDSYYDYKSQKDDIYKLLHCSHMEIFDSEIHNLTKVKSIQVSSLGIFEYKFFDCTVFPRGNTLYYRKISGSQRQNGKFYRVDNATIYFVGAWSVNNDPIKEYGSKQSEVAVLYKLSSGQYIMLVPSDKEFEILVLK